MGRSQDCSGEGGWARVLPRNKSALGVLREPRVSPSLRPNQRGDKAVPSVGRGLATLAPGRSRGSGMRGAHGRHDLGDSSPFGLQGPARPHPASCSPPRPQHLLSVTGAGSGGTRGGASAELCFFTNLGCSEALLSLRSKVTPPGLAGAALRESQRNPLWLRRIRASSLCCGDRWPHLNGYTTRHNSGSKPAAFSPCVRAAALGEFSSPV